MGAVSLVSIGSAISRITGIQLSICLLQHTPCIPAHPHCRATLEGSHPCFRQFSCLWRATSRLRPAYLKLISRGLLHCWLTGFIRCFTCCHSCDAMEIWLFVSLLYNEVGFPVNDYKFDQQATRLISHDGMGDNICATALLHAAANGDALPCIAQRMSVGAKTPITKNDRRSRVR
jgi:hypothetical protein